MGDGENPDTSKDMLDLHPDDDISDVLSEMDAGEEMRLLEENPPSPQPGSPVPTEGLSSDDELMAGDDVLDNEAQELQGNRDEMATPPLLDNPESSMQPPRASEIPNDSNHPDQPANVLSDGELSSEEELPSNNPVESSSGSKIVGTIDLLSDSQTDSSFVREKSTVSAKNAATVDRFRALRMQRRQRELAKRSESRLPESRSIAKARTKPPSTAGSVTGELQQGLRQLDFSSPGQRPLLQTKKPNGNSTGNSNDQSHDSDDGMTEVVNFPISTPMEATTSMNRDAYRPSNARENLLERVEYEERESRVKTEPMSQDDQAMAALNEHEKLRKCRKLLHRIEGVQNFGNFQYSQENLRYVGLIRDRYEDHDRVKKVYDKEVDYLKTAVKEKFEEQIQKLKLMRDLEIKKLDQKKDLALTQLLHSSGPLEVFHSLDEVLNQQKELCEDAERDPLKLDELMGKYHSMKKSIDESRTKYVEGAGLLQRKLTEVAQAKVVQSNKIAIDEKDPLFVVEYPTASKKRRSEGFSREDFQVVINLDSDEEPSSTDAVSSGTMPSRQNKRPRLGARINTWTHMDRQQEIEKKQSRSRSRGNRNARRGHTMTYDVSTDEQEEPCRRKVTLNKNFLDRLASDFMTIEPQVSKRSKSHDRVRDRERSPIRKRRNSAEEHPSPRSSRSRHRSGRSSRAFGRSGGDPEPAHLDSKDAVTLVECSKINSEKIDFRNTEKNFSRYMGLFAGKEYYKQLLVVDIRDADVLYIDVHHNCSVRVFRGLEKPDSPASACIIKVDDGPDMIAVLARDGIRVLKQRYSRRKNADLTFEEVIKFPIDFAPAEHLGKHSFAYVGLETCTFEGEKCLVTFNKNKCQLEYFAIPEDFSSVEDISVKLVELARDYKNTLYMSKTYDANHLFLSVNDIGRPFVARVSFNGEPDVSWQNKGIVHVPKDSIDMMAGVCETPNGTLLICDGNGSKYPQYGNVWAVLESKEYDKSGKFVPVKLQDKNGRNITVRRSVDIVSNHRNIFLCTHPLSDPKCRTKAEIYAFARPDDF